MKEGLSEEQYSAAQKHLEDQGGKIKDTFDREGVAPGFQVEFPADAVNTCENVPNVAFVEKTSTVRTQ